MGPGDVPAEVRGLTQADEMLIERAAPIMRVYLREGGRRGYGVHAANVAHAIGDLLHRLPRASTDVPVLVMRPDGHENGTHKEGDVGYYHRRPSLGATEKSLYCTLMLKKAFNSDRSPYTKTSASKLTTLVDISKDLFSELLAIATVIHGILRASIAQVY